MESERVFDWQGGPLRIVQVADFGFARHEEEIGTSEHVPIEHGLALPSPLVAELKTPAPESEPVAEIEVGVVNGRPACVAIRALGDTELSTTTLHRVSPMIRLLVRELVRNNAVAVTRIDGELIGERYINQEGWSPGPDPLAGVRVEADEITRRRRRRTVTPEFLREVADVYRDACAKGLPTGRTIAERWHTSETNARRWVLRARKHEILGEPPKDRQAGEQPTNPPEGKKD